MLVWPCNRESVYVFTQLDTQWRISMAGATGLDYAALPEVWRRARVPQVRRDAVFADLRLMERAALAAMHEKDT